ncbi:hypothetical protein [Terrisporobacter vanillatitrophus]|uniref:hypothetical protein n=1 Tax=Terrisporobacter vanillatitrophus TaxID=3058402 RepID=UPI0033678E0F
MIRSLQGFRALGMISIFLFHSGLLLKGTFPITFFFMLSGFVLYYSYSNRIKSMSINDDIVWVINRMKRMYPIHLITYVMSVIIRWEWICKFEIIELISKAFWNLSLLQSYYKIKHFHSMDYHGFYLHCFYYI